MKRVMSSLAISSSSNANKKTNNINHIIADKFTQLADIYLLTLPTTTSTTSNTKTGGTGGGSNGQLKFKATALKAAAKKIRDSPILITSTEVAVQQVGISERMSIKIKEILETGHLAELDNQVTAAAATTEDKSVSAISELTQITGIGPKKAQSLIDAGFTSITKLRQGLADGTVKLTHHIEVGIRWYEDLLLRMPRTEVAQIEAIIKAAAIKVDPDLMVVIAGSYRRGRPDCGDIDVLITNKSKIGEEIADYGYLKKIVAELHTVGLMKDDLSEGGKIFMGVCQLTGGKGRRIDIRMVNYDNFYAALLYFTGSKDFNIKLRKKAMELGLKLNEYSFESNATGEKIIVHSEEELFKILGMPFVAPSDRSI